METILDTGHTWFLDRLTYDGALNLAIVEAFRSKETEDLKIGDHTLTDLHRIEPSNRSRHVTVRFEGIVTWQCVNESFSVFEESEIRDTDGFVQILSQSPYLDYVNANHGLYQDTVGAAHHYRVWTEDEVVDVVATKSPVIELRSSV